MKKHFKGVAATILAFSMALAMTACGSKNIEPETEPVTMSVEEEGDGQETETEAVRETEELPEGMVRSFLTGEVVTREQAYKRPVAVMISNIQDALPQSGIANAGILYEAVVESEITRLMAVFESTDAVGDYLGSVRSCRHYYIDFARDESAAYAHFGLSFVAENRMKDEGILTMHMMTAEPGSCYIRTDDRVAPHNVFTNSEMLEKGIDMFGLQKQLADDYEGRLKFNLTDKIMDGGEAAKRVVIPFTSECELVYDEASRTYLKYEYGEPHMDEYNDVQLSFKNIIIQQAVYGMYENDPLLKVIELQGTGRGYYISDGKATKITWKKTDLNNDKTHYYLEDGSELYLNPGKTYIAVAPCEYEIGIYSE